MDPVGVVVFAAALPAVATAVVLLLVARFCPGPVGRAAQFGSALGAGFVAGFLGIAGVPDFPPVLLWQWLLPLAVAGVVVSLIEARSTRATAVRWALRAALIVFAVWAALLHRTPLGLAALSAGALVFAESTDWLAARAGASGFLATLFVVAASTAVSLAVSGTATLGFVCGSLAAGIGVGLAVAAWRPLEVRSAVPSIAALLVMFWMNGALLAELPAATTLLLAAVPATAAFVDVFGARLGPKTRFVVRTTAAVVVAGVAVAVAFAKAPPLDY